MVDKLREGRRILFAPLGVLVFMPEVRMVDWYWAERGEKRGPLSIEELQELVLEGTLTPDHFVWRPGWSAWRRASEVEGLHLAPALPTHGIPESFQPPQQPKDPNRAVPHDTLRSSTPREVTSSGTPPVQTYEHARSPEGASNASGPKGIGGWLILLAIGLVMNPIFLAALIVSDVGEEYPTPGLESLAMFEDFVLSVFCVWSIVLLIFFFRESPRFPSSFTAFLLASLTWSVLTLAVALSLAGGLPTSVTEDILRSEGRAVFRGILSAAVWIPYVKRSRRVRNTFV